MWATRSQLKVQPGVSARKVYREPFLDLFVREVAWYHALTTHMPGTAPLLHHFTMQPQLVLEMQAAHAITSWTEDVCRQALRCFCAFSQVMLHRDIKPPNFVRTDAAVLVIDFEYAVARSAVRHQRVDMNVGCYLGRAPEACASMTEDDAVAAQVWAMGACLLTGVTSNTAAVQAVRDGASVRSVLGTDTPLAAVVERMLQVNPRHRITLTELAAHPFTLGNDGWEMCGATVTLDPQFAGVLGDHAMSLSELAACAHKLLVMTQTAGFAERTCKACQHLLLAANDVARATQPYTRRGDRYTHSGHADTYTHREQCSTQHDDHRDIDTMEYTLRATLLPVAPPEGVSITTVQALARTGSDSLRYVPETADYAQAAVLVAQVATLKQQVQRAAAERGQLQTERNDLELEVAGLRQRMVALRDAADDNGARAASLQEQVAGLQAEVAARDEQLHKLQAANDVVVQQLAAAQQGYQKITAVFDGIGHLATQTYRFVQRVLNGYGPLLRTAAQVAAGIADVVGVVGLLGIDWNCVSFNLVVESDRAADVEQAIQDLASEHGASVQFTRRARVDSTSCMPLARCKDAMELACNPKVDLLLFSDERGLDILNGGLVLHRALVCNEESGASSIPIVTAVVELVQNACASLSSQVPILVGYFAGLSQRTKESRFALMTLGRVQGLCASILAFSDARFPLEAAQHTSVVLRDAAYERVYLAIDDLVVCCSHPVPSDHMNGFAFCLLATIQNVLSRITTQFLAEVEALQGGEFGQTTRDAVRVMYSPPKPRNNRASAIDAAKLRLLETAQGYSNADGVPRTATIKFRAALPTHPAGLGAFEDATVEPVGTTTPTRG